MRQFTCVNCNQKKTNEGKIFWILKPFLFVLFILPIGGKLCADCGQKFNAIGFILFVVSVPLLIVYVFSLLK